MGKSLLLSSRSLRISLALTIVGAIGAAACGNATPEEPLGATSQALSTGLVLGRVYAGGGGATSPYKLDYVELFNRGTSAVDTTGMSIQYASSTGPSSGMWATFALPTASIPPGGFFLIAMGGPATGATGADFVLTPDAAATTLGMGGGAGKVALVASATPLACGSATLGRCAATSYIDMLGYGTGTTDYEGALLPFTTDSTKAFQRKGGGCTETDDNSADFEIVAVPAPRNSTSTAVPCSGGTDAGTDAAADTAADTGIFDAAADTAPDTGIFDAAADTAHDTAVVDAADAGSDTAVADTGVADTAVADTAVADTAVADTAVADTAVADAPADTAVADAPADTAVADTAVADTATDDTATDDTGTVADTGTVVDTGVKADTGTKADTGSVPVAEPDTSSGCSCTTAGHGDDRAPLTALASFLVVGLVVARRRRG
jgi:hypothetical protein